MCELLESAGCRLKTERGYRVFPVSDHASDVTKALTRLLSETGVSIRLRTEVRSIEQLPEGGFALKAFDQEHRHTETF